VKGAPYILLVLPIEGQAHAILVCSSYEDEERLAVDLAGREPLRELADALRELADVLGREAA
jgi:hypothetical protein